MDTVSEVMLPGGAIETCLGFVVVPCNTSNVCCNTYTNVEKIEFEMGENDRLNIAKPGLTFGPDRP